MNDDVDVKAMAVYFFLLMLMSDVCDVDLDPFDVDSVFQRVRFQLVLDNDPVDDVSFGDADVDREDFAVTDLGEEDVVDVFGLDVHCRCQLACSRCIRLFHDDLLVGTILLSVMLLLDGSILCRDAILHDDVDDDATLDALLLANSNDAIRDVDHDPNLHDDVANDATLLLVLLPIDDPILLRCSRWDPGIQDVVVQSCCR